MKLITNTLSGKEVYKLLTGLVTPRPIAFVTSQNQDGVVNAAPFSFFNVVCSNPPMLGISVSRTKSGEFKDTSRNINASGEFVVHAAEKLLIEQINHTSCPYPAHISEVEKAGFHLLPCDQVKVPRIAECRVAMECKLIQMTPLGEGPSTDLIIGEVVCFHIDDEIVKDYKIDVMKLNLAARLAGAEYAALGDRFSLERPKYIEEK